MKSSANRAVFLDRDGVINRKAPDGQYVTRWEDFHFLPGVADAISVLKSAGFLVIVVTNQRCVAKGLVSSKDMDIVHRRMVSNLAEANAVIDGVYCCPHEIDPPCECRKPRPGLLLEAARAHGVDLTNSWMIGDSPSDVEAGKNASCKTVRIMNSAEPGNGRPDLIAQSLPDAAQKILVSEGLQCPSAPR